MTLGIGLPRAFCPYCATEGVISSDQQQTGKKNGTDRLLKRNTRFTCRGNHAWLTPTEDAELIGAFLARQEAAP